MLYILLYYSFYIVSFNAKMLYIYMIFICLYVYMYIILFIISFLLFWHISSILGFSFSKLQKLILYALFLQFICSKLLL